MTESPIQTIEKELNRAIHRATLHARELFHDLPELLDVLIPPNGNVSDKDKTDRALAAEELIRAAIAAVAEYDNMAAEALLIVLGLKHNPSIQHTTTLGRTLQKRRIEASAYLNVSVHTFRRNYERTLIATLAFEILRIQRGNQERPRAACE